jgi:hypothetical protein
MDEPEVRTDIRLESIQGIGLILR